MTAEPVKSATYVIGLESWADYKELVADWVENGICGSPITQWVFRGQESEDFRLIASLDRRFPGLAPCTRLSLYKETLSRMQESGEFPEGKDMAEGELGGILQHFGAPTRLLDWTGSPYVAAYFAMLDTGASHGEDFDGSCAVWGLHKQSAIWEAQAGLSLQRADYGNNARAKAQRGFFTQNMTLNPDLEDFVDQYHAEWPGRTLTKVVIPRDQATLALREMELMGVHAHSLFPGLEGASRHAFFRAQDQLGLL